MHKVNFIIPEYEELLGLEKEDDDKSSRFGTEFGDAVLGRLFAMKADKINEDEAFDHLYQISDGNVFNSEIEDGVYEKLVTEVCDYSEAIMKIAEYYIDPYIKEMQQIGFIDHVEGIDFMDDGSIHVLVVYEAIPLCP